MIPVLDICMRSFRFCVFRPSSDLRNSYISTFTTTMGEKEAVAQPAVSFWTALVAGGMAGTAVDIGIFPIDTIKTRLQSPVGFWKAGGFRGVYNGVSAVAAGSAPGAAAFFASYEWIKGRLSENSKAEKYASPSVRHMIAASVGEAVACIIRVPTEVVKARMQTDGSASFLNTLQRTVAAGELYRGFGITLMREIPFACIQFPLYEQLKTHLPQPPDPLSSAACGSAAGAVAAALTTPLDVVKTRLQLGSDANGIPYTSALDVLRRTPSNELWRGIQPRVLWISLGGFIFFGAYEGSKSMLVPYLG